MRRAGLVCGLSFVITASGAQAASKVPVIDLSTQPVVVLQNLPWEFYWQQYINPEQFSGGNFKPDAVLQRATVWNGLQIGDKQLGSFGYATYRLRLTIKTHEERVALRMPAPLAAYRLFVNGQLLAQEGTLSTAEAGFMPKRKSALVFFHADAGQMEIVIHVANYLLYKGGLRSQVELGRASFMQSYGLRYLSLDVFCMGLIFSIMLYHFLLYLLSRRDRPVLIFALLALNYFLLAALFGEQSFTLFWPEFPLNLHTRLTSVFTYLLPALVVHFTTTLYPGTVSQNARRIFWLLAAVFICLLVLPARYFMAYNVYYYSIIGIAAAAVCLRAVYAALREKRAGARLLAFGILILIALTVYAVFLFTTHSQAGSFISIGFALFALTQSGSLAHAHAALTRENSAMQLSLERSRQALDSQRKQIEANLHDSLGGNLTDIKLGLEAIEKDPRAARLKPEIRRLDQRVGGTIASLRTQLLFLEDMQMAVNDFVSGINLILLRRYQMARRPVEIRVSPESRAQSRNLIANRVISEENIPELCLIVQELCSNTLKYSAGTAEWEITATGTGLQIRVNTKSRRAPSGSGRGRHTLRARTEAIGAKFEEVFSGRNYQASVEMRSSS